MLIYHDVTVVQRKIKGHAEGNHITLITWHILLVSRLLVRYAIDDIPMEQPQHIPLLMYAFLCVLCLRSYFRCHMIHIRQDNLAGNREIARLPRDQ